LSNWLWFSDAFPLTDPRERSERSVWAESSTGILDRLPAEEIARLAQTYGPTQMVHEQEGSAGFTRVQQAEVSTTEARK
jgi:hypothetical protein